MICLSLRVSGEKNTDRSKVVDQRVDQIKSVVSAIMSCVPQTEYWMNELVNAETLKEQIEIITSVFEHNVNNNVETSSATNQLDLLLQMYLELPVANPLKKYLLSCFSEMEAIRVSDLCKVVDGLLNTRFKHGCGSDVSQQFLSLLNCINSCFNKHSCLETLLANSSHTVFHTTKDLISSCSIHLRDSSVTPVFKEKMLKNIHCLSQGIITFLHKVTPECLPPLFLESCKLFLNDENLPLNTKTNIAIIISLVNQITKAYEWDELIKSFCQSSPITEVSLCCGIYSTADDSLWNKLACEEYLAHFILYHLLSLEEKNSSDCKVVLGVSRGVCQYSKILVSSGTSCASSEKRSVERVLSYLWIHLDHPMDAVRHLASETLSNFVTFGHKYPESNIIGRIVEELREIALYRRSKYVILSSLVGCIAVEQLLLQVPNLVKILLLSLQESSGAKHVVVSFEKLMSQHYVEIENKNDWISIWVDPVIEILNRDAPSVMEQILTHIIKLNPSLINYIFELDDKLYKNKMRILLLGLRVSQKLGILKGDSQVKWKGFIEYPFLESSLHHKERDARLSLLGLIVDSSKSSEPFTEKELDLVELFLTYNVNCQSPAFRQSFLALFKKFLGRLKDSHNDEKCRKINDRLKQCEEDKFKCDESCFYKRFLRWVIEFSCEQLFPGAAFSRRSTSLNILSLLFSYGLCQSANFTKDMTQRLLYVLQADTYEENKKLSKEIIQNLEFDLLALENNKMIYDAFNDCLSFASSIRPPDCISAAYSLSTLLAFTPVKQAFSSLADSDKQLIKEAGIYQCLSMIVDDLCSKVEVACKDIHRAAKEGPMYGLLFTIRHIFQTINLYDVSSDKSWIELIKIIIKLGIESTKAVSCIVNNSSPEGHLPMDLSLDFSNLTLADGSHQATSQLLLLCSWRTVKEVCLLFGEIVDRVNIYPEDDGIHFSVKDVLIVGEHLTSLLSEIKHRGAFEQAYIGFCKVAATLWKYPKGHLHELPSVWLKETLGEIVSSKAKLCATRRSAGIPFIIQALVVTEREVLGGKELEWTVNKVLELGSSSSESWETRVHAMNILRSLYRSSHLGEAISPFVAQGFIISFNGFSAQTWPERNSATLLFSALVTRVFGVNRSRSHNLSWKNKMTGRIFFQRYPELYSVILEKLKKSSDSDIHSVFPVLLLLSRLYPSSLEGSDSNLRLENLIPFIGRCGGSRIMKIRCLAASALVALIYPLNICAHITQTLNDITLPSASENAVHGSLLQVVNLLKSGPEIPDESSELDRLVNAWFNNIVSVLKDNKRSAVTKSSCLSALFQLLLKYYKLIYKDSINNVLEFLKSELFKKSDPHVREIIGTSEFVEKCLILIILNSGQNECDTSLELLNLLKLNNYEAFQLVLDFILTILAKSESNYEDISQYVETLSDDYRILLAENFKLSRSLGEYIHGKLLEGSLHHEDSVKLMSVVKELPIVMEELARVDSTAVKILSGYFSSESLKSCVIRCFSSYMALKDCQIDECLAATVTQLLTECVKSDYDCRLAAADLLVIHHKSIMNSFSSSIRFGVWDCLVNLMSDDWEEVRNRMSEILPEPVDSVLAFQHLFQYLKNNINDKFTFACALVAWSICPFCEEQYNLEQTEKAFDKGDMNSYKEDVVLTVRASLTLKQLIEEFPHLLDQTIPPHVHAWFDDLDTSFSSSQTLKQAISSLDAYVHNTSQQSIRKYHYFVQFSNSYRNYSLLNEKRNKLELSLR